MEDIEGIVRRFANDEMERDDLRQEIAIALWRAMDRFRGESAERTYVVRIARNRALTFSAQRARRRTLLQALQLEQATSEDEDAESSFDAIRGALHSMSDSERSLLELAAAGFSPRQIADRVGKSAGAVRVALHRARTALKALLQRDGDRS